MSSPSGRTTVGVVGAGQLARMMLPAAIALDVDVRLLAAGADESAARVWPEVVVGSPDSSADLDGFAAICDVLTFDHELVDPRRLAALEAARHCLRPSAATQRFAQDKGFQRSRFAAAGLPVPEHALVTGENELLDFVSRRGWPVVLKTRRGGYDGRGVWIVHAVEEARELLERAAAGDGLVVERWLPIERELAVLIARRPSGESVTYPVVETVQVDGICHEVIAPAAIAPEMAAAAEALAGHVATLTNVTGILAVELFLAEGRLSINEVAVRPHNSGHFSIEGAETSQFENHLRGVLDLPLGATTMTAPAVVMANVLGARSGADPRDHLAAALAVPGIHVHLYGKAVRPGRKLGHVTARGEDAAETRARARMAAALLAGGIDA